MWFYTGHILSGFLYATRAEFIYRHTHTLYAYSSIKHLIVQSSREILLYMKWAGARKLHCTRAERERGSRVLTSPPPVIGVLRLLLHPLVVVVVSRKTSMHSKSSPQVSAERLIYIRIYYSQSELSVCGCCCCARELRKPYILHRLPRPASPLYSIYTLSRCVHRQR